MTRCNLLNVARVKQIVPRSQIWFLGSSVSQLVQISYSRHKARHKGNQLGNQGLQVLVLGQQTFHLIQNHGRIFVLLRPVKSSKIVEQGEQRSQLFHIDHAADTLVADAVVISECPRFGKGQLKCLSPPHGLRLVKTAIEWHLVYHR